MQISFFSCCCCYCYNDFDFDTGVFVSLGISDDILLIQANHIILESSRETREHCCSSWNQYILVHIFSQIHVTFLKVSKRERKIFMKIKGEFERKIIWNTWIVSKTRLETPSKELPSNWGLKMSSAASNLSRPILIKDLSGS